METRRISASERERKKAVLVGGAVVGLVVLLFLYIQLNPQGGWQDPNGRWAASIREKTGLPALLPMLPPCDPSGVVASRADRLRFGRHEIEHAVRLTLNETNAAPATITLAFGPFSGRPPTSCSLSNEGPPGASPVTFEERCVGPWIVYDVEVPAGARAVAVVFRAVDVAPQRQRAWATRLPEGSGPPVEYTLDLVAEGTPRRWTVAMTDASGREWQVPEDRPPNDPDALGSAALATIGGRADGGCAVVLTERTPVSVVEWIASLVGRGARRGIDAMRKGPSR